jgi:hypothetical protein
MAKQYLGKPNNAIMNGGWHSKIFNLLPRTNHSTNIPAIVYDIKLICSVIPQGSSVKQANTKRT